MAYIYHVSRTLLQERMAQFGHHITGRSLDIGCGTYNRYAHHLNATDIVKMDVQAGDNVDVVGSADSLPFDDGEFDSIVSTHVFEHLEFPEKAAAEAYRVLKRGGYALISVPFFHGIHDEPLDFYRYTNFGLASLFERVGFETVEYAPLGGFFANRACMSQAYIKNRLNLPSKPSWIVRPISFIYRMWGTFAIWLDSKDTSKANRACPMGWVFVFRK